MLDIGIGNAGAAARRQPSRFGFFLKIWYAASYEIAAV